VSRAAGSRAPDRFARIDGAFTAPAARIFADRMVSFTDDVVAAGFRLPGRPDAASPPAGIHGSQSRAGTLSAVATQIDVVAPTGRSRRRPDPLLPRPRAAGPVTGPAIARPTSETAPARLSRLRKAERHLH
jgi:hypothetical protein